jgi:hypothetical protein
MEVDFGRRWGLTLGVIDCRIPLGSLKDIVHKFLEVNPLKVFERVVIRSDEPPWTAKNLFRIGL